MGASDPEGLLDFIDQVEEQVESVSIRHSLDLHAKIVKSAGPLALAGSANLTFGGFVHNLEIVRLSSDEELDELQRVVDTLRTKLTPVSRTQFETFVASCVAKMDSQEALLALIREEMPPTVIGPGPLLPYTDFLNFVGTRESRVAEEITIIARNLDHNNNTGKVKQAFFGVQRFLQEYPQHSTMVSALPIDEWFDVRDSAIGPDWRRFLSGYASESDPTYGYSIPTLRGYLTEASGGIRRGGGGGDNELKRVWPFVGRLMSEG